MNPSIHSALLKWIGGHALHHHPLSLVMSPTPAFNNVPINCMALFVGAMTLADFNNTSACNTPAPALNNSPIESSEVLVFTGEYIVIPL